MVKNKFKLPKTFLTIILCTTNIQPPTAYSPSLIESKRRPRYHVTTNLFCLLLIAYCLLAFTNSTYSTIRYVSTTGSSTPPYTTWETAADSIQKCINFSVDGDTIIVANGVYYESLIVDKYLWLIGSSMDSTVIDGTGLANITIDFQSDGHIQNFWIKGKGEGTIQTTCILSNLANAYVTHCKIMNSRDGIIVVWSSTIIDKCIITNVVIGYITGCVIDTCNPVIKNSLISLNASNRGGIQIDGGDNSSLNNIIWGNFNSDRGIRSALFFTASTNIITNNIVIGFNRNIDGYASDTAIVHNNVSSYANQRGFTIGSKTDMRNNISAYNQVGAVGPTDTNSDYNLYWQNNTHTGVEGFAEHDIVADPMFVNDTIPAYGGGYDYHLQAYSPAIDAGDPEIFDVDESRSDIGAYGGPLGERYNYIDLAPKPPRNLSAVVDSEYITLIWNPNTEADFNSYNLFRDTTANFTADSTTFVTNLTDTFYIQLIPVGIDAFYYKLTATDNQGNESQPSEELGVIITSVNDYPSAVSNYQLYQNYPNPFNPSTKIGYKLKEKGYVKLMVYDIKGELVEVLVNKELEAGYYEVEFNSQVGSRQLAVGNKIASGIYIYRIEIIGDGKIPRFSDMKKMILLK